MSTEKDNVIPTDTTPDAIYQLHIDSKIGRLNKASQGIIDLVNNRVRKVPETYFYHKLLPIVRDWYKNGVADRIGDWLNVADGMYNPIIVVDDDDKSELFTLPPAYLRIPPKVIQRSSVMERKSTLAEVVDRQAIALENGDTRMVMQIEGSIASSVDFNSPSMVYFKNIYSMMGIYRRYELPLEELLGEEADVVAKTLDDLFNKPSKVTETPTPLEPAKELGIEDYDF